MKQFVIHLDNQKEQLAQIGRTLGQYDIDIVSMAGVTAFGVCTTILFTDNEKLTIEILRKLDIPFTAQDVLIASLPDIPGAFGHFTQLLLDQKIHLLSFYALRFTSNKADYAFSVAETDYEKAKDFLDASGFLQTSKEKKKPKI